jgi:hypothetical protein
MEDKIFVQIASYKDPQLKPTIVSALKTAANPEKLYFGICWQDDDFKDAAELLSLGNVSLTCVNVKHARGIGWARHRAQTLYNGEEYVLQIDSHMRFVKNWDADCKDMLGMCGKRSLLSTYLPNWHNITPKQKRGQYPMGMGACEFHPEHSMLLLCGNNENYSLSPTPVLGAFISGHFIFTAPKYFTEIPNDPQMGFGYEEGVLSARTFTHGWNVYAPNRIVCRHTWDRWIRKLVWDDRPKEFLETQKLAWSRYRQLMEMDEKNIKFGKYGLGKERTLREFEEFSGLDFKKQKIEWKGVFP